MNQLSARAVALVNNNVSAEIASVLTELSTSLDESEARFRDLQNHCYAGHIVKCSDCGCNLTSLLLCPECGMRYQIKPVEAQ